MSAHPKKVDITLRSYINHDYQFKNNDGVIGVYIDEDQVSVFIEDKNGVTRFSIDSNSDKNQKDNSGNFKWTITEEPRESQTNAKIRELRKNSPSWAESQVDRSGLMAFKEDMIELASKSYSRETMGQVPLIAAKQSRISLDLDEPRMSMPSFNSRNSG